MLGPLAEWRHEAFWTLRPGAYVAAVLTVVMLVLAVRLGGRNRRGERHRRGTLVRRQRRWPRTRPGAAMSGAASVMLAGVRIAAQDETKHFKLIGTTGTGKSTAIRELLGVALRRGDRALISDPGGAYLRHFARRYRGDVILNPFEADSASWDLFAELHSDYDADQLASALIADSADAATREWRAYARTFLAAVVRRCRQRGMHSLAELWRLLAVAPAQELAPLVRGTPAQPFLDPDNARMFGSIRSVTSSAIGALEYIEPQRAAPLSVRNWVRAGRGALFIPYRAGQVAALRSLIAAWIRLAIFEAMDGPEEVDQRLWFIIDELDALGAIDGLKDALARLRKFGGRCLLGVQSIAQVSSIYGHGEAQTIIENCGNTLILRCSGSENGGTSQFASRLIGEREVVRPLRTRARDRHGAFAGRRSLQVSEQQVLELAVLASELEQLPDLTGYLKTASSRQWLRVELQHR
ncbi:MAG: type IV secretion system DNA-binding domain-containing protein [Steroidobacteraceae bacterium]